MGRGLFRENFQLELEILSSLLLDPTLVAEVSDQLAPEDFEDQLNRLVYRAILSLDRKGHPVDPGTLKEEVCRLVRREKLELRWDDQRILLHLERFCPKVEQRVVEIELAAPAVPLERYVQRLKDQSLRRRLVEFALQVPKLVEEGRLSLPEVADRVEQLLYKIISDSSRGDFKSAGEVVQETEEWLRERERQQREGRFLTGLDTGFIDLNRMTSGFGAGDLIIIAARPSMGKTAFALNLATNVLRQGKGVAIFSLEMPADQLMLRILSSEGMVPLQGLRTGNLPQEEWGKVREVLNWVRQAPLFINDTGEVTIQTIKSQLRKMKLQHPELSLAIIDYLQLVQGRGRERHLEVAEISRGLKLLARELQIPIIALSQLNRALESRPNKRPILSDLRESGSIEQDADLIMFIYRDSVYKELEERKKIAEARAKGEDYQPKFIARDPDEAELIIGKQRNGPVGTIEMLFHRKFVKFADKLREEVEQTEARVETEPQPVRQLERTTSAPSPHPSPGGFGTPTYPTGTTPPPQSPIAPGSSQTFPPTSPPPSPGEPPTEPPTGGGDWDPTLPNPGDLDLSSI
jgi:replicative DNA helicase